MTSRKRFIASYAKALVEGAGTIFVGAGTSVGAGYPDWKGLLREIGEELELDVDDVGDLAALAQWSVQKEGSRSSVQRVIDKEIGVARPVPRSLELLARLPIRHIWTTNYDELIERSLADAGRPYRVRFAEADLSTRGEPGAALVYKMHGTISNPSSVVISTDDYERYRRERGAFLNLLQAHLMSTSMLFVGLSFTDPNLRHVLSIIREIFHDSPPAHFGIARAPQVSDFENEEIYNARFKQYQYWKNDLKRYGLTIVEVDEYTEIDEIISEISKAVSKHRVWVSGSWPEIGEVDAKDSQNIFNLSCEVGRVVASQGRALVTGVGLVVGSGSISGFVEQLRNQGVWQLSDQLIARPFPQPLAGVLDVKEQWSGLRKEMAEMAGTAVFIGGLKATNGGTVVADGVLEEFNQCREHGVFLIPIGASGGAAEVIANQLLGSAIPTDGPFRQRPSDTDLKMLLDKSKSLRDLCDIVARLIAKA